MNPITTQVKRMMVANIPATIKTSVFNGNRVWADTQPLILTTYINFVKFVYLHLYASIMSSFKQKKRHAFLLNDIHCRNIILSLHFLSFRLEWKQDMP